MSLKSFLKTYEVSKDEPYTHTSLNKDTVGGKYFIPKSQFGKFFGIYFDYVFNQKKPAYLIEKHPSSFSKICIDLDLKYDKTVCERQYTEDMIKEVVRIYIDEIKCIVKNLDGGRILAYVFEKGDGVMTGDYWRDGVHVMFPFIKINYAAQYLIRERVVEKVEKSGIFGNCVNSVDKIIDKSVVEKNGWLMYGSTKANGKKYKITRVYDENLCDMELPNINIDFLKVLSILDTTDEIPVKITKNEDRRKKQIEQKIDEVLSFGDKSMEESGDSEDEMEEEGESESEIVGGKIVGGSIVKRGKVNRRFIRELLGLLKSDRCDDYDSWFLVGASLYNTDVCLLDEWKDWSERSKKYDEGHCDRLWEKTFPNYNGVHPATLGTLRKYARIDNEQKYLMLIDKFNERDQFYSLLKNGLYNTHNDFAKIVYHLYEGEFVYSEEEWYNFEGNRWKKIKENPIQLKRKISNEIIHHFIAYQQYLSNKAYNASSMDDEKQRDVFFGLSEQCNKVIKNLKSTVTKTHIVNECKEIFYDEEFKDKLDTDIYLLGFNNGVLNLMTNEFRRGMPGDRVSFSCGYDYTSVVNEDVRKELYTEFMKIQPDREILEFLLTYLASTLIGTNKNELFINLEGSGGNGKGLIATLHSCALGDYAGTLNNNYVVNTFSSPESHNTMLATNYKKRFLQVNEPANTKNLNINLIKELTGCDDIQLRVAHSAETKTVEPLFKLCMLFNELPKIENTKDGGFIRRFVGIRFPSKFVDREPKTLNEYRKDPNLKQKIKTNVEWHQQYMLILLEYLKKYIGNKEIIEIPDKIKRNTQRLLNAQDPFEDFIENKLTVTKNESDYVRRIDLWNEFREFYRSNYPDKLRISSKQFMEKIGKTMPDGVSYRSSMTLQMERSKKVLMNVYVGLKIADESTDCGVSEGEGESGFDF